jgi:hypothetical protein
MKKLIIRLSLFAILSVILQANSCYPDEMKGCDCEAESTAHAIKTISSGNPSASFSVYEFTGTNQADAACHAQMELTFRWASDVRAKTGERPYISYEFTSLFGYFPTNTNMEQLTIDENGIHTYKISIDEASDKTKPEGSNYGFQLNFSGEPTNADVIECDMKIKYRQYSEDAYVNGCTDSPGGK